MKPSRLLVLPLLLAAGFLTACGGVSMPCSDNAITGYACTPPKDPGTAVVGQKVVVFEPDGTVAVPGTVSDKPVDPDLVRGWYAAKSGTGITEARAPKPEPAAEEGMAYVAVSRTTACQKTDKAELRRQGDELISVFTGTGSAPQECVRAYTAYAQFAVPKAAVAGVKSIDGQPVVDAEGPAKQIAFVKLTGLDDTRFAPVVLRDGKEKGLREQFLEHGVSSSDVVVLEQATPAGKKRVAYLLEGCAETRARLIVSPAVLQAELVRDTATDCEQATRFLVVFELAAENLPQGAMPVVYGQR